MLEIHACKDISLYTQHIAKHNLPPDVQIIEAYDGGRVIGYGIFLCAEDLVTLFQIDCTELELFDGIVRTILFKASMKGIDRAELQLWDMERAYSLGFLKRGEKVLSSIQEIMGGCRGCK